MPLQPDPGPNWAEIVSAAAGTIGVLVGLPTLVLFLKDRHHARQRGLGVRFNGTHFDGALTLFRARFTPEDSDEALFLEVRVIGPGRLVTEAEYIESAAGQGGYGESAIVLPKSGARSIRISMVHYLHSSPGELEARFGAIGASVGSGVNLKVAVVTHPSRKTLIQRKATISSPP